MYSGRGWGGGDEGREWCQSMRDRLAKMMHFPYRNAAKGKIVVFLNLRTFEIYFMVSRPISIYCPFNR